MASTFVKHSPGDPRNVLAFARMTTIERYSTLQLKTATPPRLEDARQYGKLLRSFVDATFHLESNAESEGCKENWGAIWKVMLWLQTLYNKLEKNFNKLKTALYHTI